MSPEARTAGALPTRYEPDELALGACLAIALHALPVALLAFGVAFPTGDEPVREQPKPVIAAALLKLGKPIDPKRLPDRVVPRAATAPRKEAVASREEPDKRAPDAGPPPPLAKESDLANLIKKTDPFAEDAGVARAEEGRAEGVAEGTTSDPNKVRAGDMYAAQLAKFFRDRWQIPTVISQGEASRLCVTFQISIGPRMALWRVKPEPVRKSGNDLFDDSARTMLDKLLDDRTGLPDPPAEVADSFRGRTVNLLLTGDANGDVARCK
ncbi:MAG: hypothetical protein IPG50_29075 [Myxococcales bacterium]|nr:hypothetical protein [Myxococcales bacterium]